MDHIENKTFDELAIGDSASLVRTLSQDDIQLFAVMSGDVNPSHVDEEFARSDTFHKVVAHGMWGGALISNVLGTQLPGAGTLYLNQTLSFKQPILLGDTVTVKVTVVDKDPATHNVTFDCTCLKEDGSVAIEGQALVQAPTRKINRPKIVLPEVHLHEKGARYQRLVEMTRELEPLHTAVVHPVDAVSLLGAVEAAREGLIVPTLIGPEHRIRAAAEQAGIDLGALKIVASRHSHEAAELAVKLVHQGDVEALMKGALHTDELMGEVVNARTGLRTERRVSHVFAMDVPTYPKPLLISDAAINISPDLEAKRDIVQSAIDLAHALGNENPKVAILSAVETVYPKIPSTIDSAALCKMADRGQITGGTLDGPLAFDNAVSEEAARTKNITSPVAGRADILIVPDLEAGNMLAKQLEYLAGAQAAGIVLGARVPIMLTSRADKALARMASCALALLYTRHQRGIRVV
jgi:phosphate acetyltransferase